MGACGSKSAKNNFKGNGNSLQQAQQLSAATTEKPGSVTPASPTQSPGYRLGGPLDPEKVASSPPGNGGAPQSQNDQIEREKRLQAIAMRENKLKGKTVKPRVFQPEQ